MTMVEPETRLLMGLFLWVVPTAVGVCAAYFFLSLPMRRHERARLFLDLLEQSLTDGRNLEHTVVGIARSRDECLGVRFHCLAAFVETGLRLGQALERVPHFLPPQVNAMLKVGEEIGDVRKVLPACRQLLKDGLSQTRSAVNYLILFAVVLTPVAPLIFQVLATFVFPKIILILGELETPAPWFATYVLQHARTLATILTVLAVAAYGAGIVFLGGPRLARWFQWRWFPLSDWLSYRLPWRRKRMLRDFAAMLGLLLDADVPEGRAVTFAADATANLVLQKRAERVVSALNQGHKLPDAMRQMDDTGEFRWRLVNAAHSPTGFRAALNGWLEALDAKAFQQQQAAAQITTTGLVLFNGALVGLMVVCTFQILISIIDTTALW